MREGRCEEHALEYERKRGSGTERGYDSAHRNERARIAGRIARGAEVVCWRCGGPIDGEWDLGHDDAGSVAGPEHRNRCNRRAAGLKAAGQEWSQAPGAAARAPLSADLVVSRVMAQRRAARAAERRRARQEAREQGL